MDDIDALEIDEEELALSSPLRKRSKRKAEGLHRPNKAAQAPGLLPDGWPGHSALHNAGPSIRNCTTSSPLFPAGRPATVSRMGALIAAHEQPTASQLGLSGRPGTPLP